MHIFLLQDIKISHGLTHIARVHSQTC